MVRTKKANNREATRRAHEAAMVQAFVDWLTRSTASTCEILSTPDPPDAIIQLGNKRTWLEHTDVWLDKDDAHERYSDVTIGEEPYRIDNHFVVEPDKRIAMRMVCEIKKKGSNMAYKSFFDKYGPGILILNLMYYWPDLSTINYIREELDKINLERTLPLFGSAYWSFYRPNKMEFQKFYAKEKIF